MPWDCAVCGAREGKDDVKLDAVCHHCGKLLCQKHRVQILDDAFDSGDGAVGRQAYHCEECRSAYHPRASVIRAGSTL